MRDDAVWGLTLGDGLAGARWKAAANRWRSEAHDAGLSNAAIWAALPARRFLRERDEQQLKYMLWPLGLTVDDLDTLAAEAVAAFPFVFDPMWQHGASSADADWHLRDLRARRGELPLA